MKLPSERTSGFTHIRHARSLWYGPPKIGKSTLLSGFPDSLFLATEKGYVSLKIYKIDIRTWEEFKDAVELVVKGKHTFKTIVIDVVDILYDLCEDYICTKMDIEHVSDEDWGKAYSAVRKEFESELNKLFMTDYGIAFVSHIKTDEIVAKAGRYSKVVPSVSKAARRILIPKVDIIGCMRLKAVKLKSGEFIEKRVVSFDPSEFMESGDRTGRLPTEVTLTKDAKKNYELLEAFYK